MSTRLGATTKLWLLDAGARVAAVELDAPAIEETQDAVEDRGAGERFLGIGADVTYDESGAKILRATTERFGRLDILINNAGISTGLLRGEDQTVGKSWETTPEEFRRVIDGVDEAISFHIVIGSYCRVPVDEP